MCLTRKVVFEQKKSILFVNIKKMEEAKSTNPTPEGICKPES